MLHRVVNLSKSTDKRLQESILYPHRKRGQVGTIIPSEWNDDTDKNIFYLHCGTGAEIGGVYRIEELEEVTDKQLQLETDLAALLSVFPNKNPSNVLGINANFEDFLTIETVVPVLRKRYKREFAEQRRVINKFLNRLFGGSNV